MSQCRSPLNPANVWAPSPGMTSCYDCGSPCCGFYTTQEECEQNFNDNWFGLPRWFWYGLAGLLAVLFLLGGMALYLLLRYSPAGRG